MGSITNYGIQADLIAKDEHKQLIADHRYDVIYPIIRCDNEKSKRKLFDELAKLEYVNPVTMQSIKYSSSTIKRWYYTYINNGCKRSCLMTKSRNDANKTRVLTNKICEDILQLKKEFPYMSATKIHELLVINGKYDASLRTVSSFIAKQQLNHKKKHDKQRMPIEKEFSNMLWYGDTNYGPFIKINGQSVRTYLIAFIDNASRMIVGARYFLADNSINIQSTLKEAVMRWGVPDLFYFDQGKPYKEKQLARIIRGIGSNVKHAPPYTPQAKGPVERAFRTIDTRWLNNVHHDSFESLEHLNQELDIYINEYNNVIIHSTLGSTPIKRWTKDQDRIVYFDEKNIDAYFLHMISRTVKNDTTIQIDKTTYQLPSFAVKYIGKKINLFFVPDINQKNIEYMVNDGKQYVKIQVVDKVANGNKFKDSKGINDNTKPKVLKLPQFKLAKEEEQLAMILTDDIDNGITLSYGAGED